MSKNVFYFNLWVVIKTLFCPNISFSQTQFEYPFVKLPKAKFLL